VAGGRSWALHQIRALLILALAASAVALPAAAQVPADRQAAILVRALAYDRNLAARAGEAVDVAVVWRSDDAASAVAAQRHIAGFKALGDLKISGLPLRVHGIAVTTVETLAVVLAASEVDAVFVVGLNNELLGNVLSTCAKQKAVTMAASRATVEAGVALGVEAVGDKPTIFVNVAAAERDGASFAANLLRVAVVVSGAP
jgi:hypothetical protein